MGSRGLSALGGVWGSAPTFFASLACFDKLSDEAAQIQSARMLRADRAARFRHEARRVAEREEARAPSRLGLVRVHRESIVTEAAGMRHVMRHPAQAAAGPAVMHVEHQRR